MKKYIVYTLACALLLAGVAHADKGSDDGSRIKSFLGIGEKQEQRGSDDRDDEQETENESKSERGMKPADVRKEDKDRSQPRTLDDARARAIKEIDERIDALNKLVARIDAMKRVPDATKASVKAAVAAQVASLSDLKTTIQNAADATVLKEQAGKITKAYRIYMVVMPQLQIIAAADRVSTTADLLSTMAGKLETRIADAKTAGKDVAALETALADMKAKIADAKTQADAAVALTANLKPDNGDQAIMDANKKALTDARGKLKAAQESLKTARKDAQTIVKGLK